jgi:hypothetical protein
MNYEDFLSNLDLPYLTNSYKESKESFILKLKGKKNEWNIKLVLHEFPLNLPMAYLLDESFIGQLAHINESGLICLYESDSLILDYRQENRILKVFIEEIYLLLENVRIPIFQDELKDEFEGYFSNNLKYVNSFYLAKTEIEKIALRISKEDFKSSYRPLLIHDDNLSLPKNFSNVNCINSQKINILHIPLEFGMLPPSKRYLSNLCEYIKELQKNIPAKFEEFISKFINRKKTKKNNFFILFSMPRTTGERTQFLVHYYSETKNYHPLITQEINFIINLYFIDRNNESYLKERGGSNNNLSKKSVSIVGCGSVGSEIAMMLAKAGIGELILIDPDILKQDNIFRHRLGGGSLSYLHDSKLNMPKSTKVNLLKYQITKDIPYINVKSISKNFDNTFNDNKVLNSDIIIVAVGSPMVNLDINSKLKKLGINNVIFCWNEANSVGGHSVALSLEKSCFECLYTNEEGFSLNNELSFVETGQNISKNITGCGGTFTPFSYLDSSQTAILASRQCIEMLTKGLHSQALSWKTLSSVSVKVTERFSESAFQELKVLKPKSKCRVCSD